MSLELRGITKQFGSLVANDGINFKVEAGEIHAILGENGAGKSTLMNIVYGLLSPDKGEILVDGKEIKINPIVRNKRTKLFCNSTQFQRHEANLRYKSIKK